MRITKAQMAVLIRLCGSDRAVTAIDLGENVTTLRALVRLGYAITETEPQCADPKNGTSRWELFRANGRGKRLARKITQNESEGWAK